MRAEQNKSRVLTLIIAFGFIFILDVDCRYKVYTQDDCINCIDIVKKPYCDSVDSSYAGMCCDNSILDPLSPNCQESQRDCSGEVTANYYLKYALCPFSSDICPSGPSYVINNTYSKTITISPLSYTQYCQYQITTNSTNFKNFSQAIKISIVNQYYANGTFFVNQSSLTSSATITPVSSSIGSTYQFNIRDSVLLIIKSSSTSSDNFADFAQFSFKIYIDDYSASADLSGSNSSSSSSSSSTDSSSSSSSTSTSILDTYSVYFNRQSYQVSMIVIGYFGFILGWMVLILVLACIYRHVLEKRLYPLDYRLRQDAKRIRQLKMEEDENILKEMQHDEHHGHSHSHDPQNDKSHDTTFKHDKEDKYLKSSNRLNEDGSPEINTIKFFPIEEKDDKKSNVQKGFNTFEFDETIKPNSDKLKKAIASPKSNRSNKSKKGDKNANKINQDPILSPQNKQQIDSVNDSEIPIIQSYQYSQNPKFDDPDVEEIQILKQPPQQMQKMRTTRRKKNQKQSQDPQNQNEISTDNLNIDEQLKHKDPLEVNQNLGSQQSQDDIGQLRQRRIIANPIIADILIENDDQIIEENSQNGNKYTKISLEKISEESKSIHSSVYAHSKSNKLLRQMRNTNKSNFSKQEKDNQTLQNENSNDNNNNDLEKQINKQSTIQEEEDDKSLNDPDFNNLQININENSNTPKSNRSQNNKPNTDYNELSKLKQQNPRRTGEKFKEVKVVPIL